MAARLLQTAPERITIDGGVFRAQGSDAATNWIEVARAASDPQFSATGAAGLTATRRFDPPNYTFPSGCHICEVEVDPATGVVDVVGYTLAHDVGQAINPQIVRGQLVGGVVQGIGQALCEEVIYDSEGQLQSGSFQDYAMPRAGTAPPFRLVIKQVAASINPLGAKGCGEAGATAAPPAVINAIVDALASLGVRHVEMPATAMRIWDVMRAAQRARIGASQHKSVVKNSRER